MAAAPVILFVDDEKRLWEIYRARFGPLGYSLKFAEDGFAAVTAVREGKVDLVIMDLNMPHVDGQLGIEVIRELNATVPILVVSGYLVPEQTEQGIPGATAVFAKPVDLAKLQAAVETAVGKPPRA